MAILKTMTNLSVLLFCSKNKFEKTFGFWLSANLSKTNWTNFKPKCLMRFPIVYGIKIN